MNGYEMGPYGRSVGTLGWEFAQADCTAPMGDAVRGYLPDTPTVSAGPVNMIFSNVAGASHTLRAYAGATINLAVPIGIRAAPAAGDPCFVGAFQGMNYQTAEDGGAEIITMNLGGWDASQFIAYNKPWGRLLKPYEAITGANTGTGIDNGAATTAGGYMAYHVVYGNGTATISIDDSADNSSFDPLSGATTGSINTSTAPLSGFVALGNTATVRQYLRWQVALGTATNIGIVLAFVRG